MECKKNPPQAVKKSMFLFFWGRPRTISIHSNDAEAKQEFILFHIYDTSLQLDTTRIWINNYMMAIPEYLKQ